LWETRNNNIAKHILEFLPKKGEAMLAIGAGLEEKFESIEPQKHLAITFKMLILRADNFRLRETRNNYIAKHILEFYRRRAKPCSWNLERDSQF